MSVDVTRPHIGRIYDYVLGGTYNHEVDRRAAEAMIALMPAYPRWARLNRSFLAHFSKRWAAEGRTRILDLGSGLPTQDHFNTFLPDARILFSDIDPLTVAQGRQILAYTPDMAYVEADLRAPDALLVQAEAFFEGNRDLAVGCIGIVYFLPDQHLRTLMARLHAFCAPGSALALSFPAVDGGWTEEALELVRQGIKVAGIEFLPRTAEEIAELVKPWRMRDTVRLATPPGEGRAHPMDSISMHGALAEHD